MGKFTKVVTDKQKKLSEALEQFKYKDDAGIKEVVEVIGKARLTPTSHLYPIYGPIAINEAVERSAEEFLNQAESCPPLSIIDVVLAANREYNVMVKPVIDRFKKEMPDANTEFTFLKQKTFESLLEYLKINLSNFYNEYVIKDHNKVKASESINEEEREFILKVLGFKEVNHYKMKALFDLLNAIIRLKGDRLERDYDFLKAWAENIEKRKDLKNRKGIVSKRKIERSLGGKIHKVGIATIQHLRMHFGADTFKPDQRVKEVLLYKFLNLHSNEFISIDLDDKSAFSIMEKIHNSCNPPYTLRTLDSFFVNYGSGYYNKNEPSLDFANSVLKGVLKKLIQKGVDAELISEVSGYSAEELNPN
ncbi:hypothetical protein [Segetibacter aerophilus]|uniref:Uncharacterized protein n=1 Tax=Segetibacter aerophilus TaxID=670293 RepID=A0A512BIJ8_9BACT|nr:hypothetical protein [Segetibacter aerophilus]GEO11802.1 hypothetical protein SAE01_42980 [Segetibacter aerophilus]